MAHAYYVAGEAESGVGQAMAFAERELGLSGTNNPDLVVLRYGLFSVEDARKLQEVAFAAPVQGERKAIIVAFTRVFHEAQNALLKLFEEPPHGVTLILVVPTAGLLLPTLRSRLALLPEAAGRDTAAAPKIAVEFLALSADERAKFMTKLLDRTKADKDEEKQRARNDAVLLLEGLVRAAEHTYRAEKREAERDSLRLFLDDLTHFLPLLHTRSAPLKLIFEHLLLVIPKSLGNSAV